MGGGSSRSANGVRCPPPARPYCLSWLDDPWATDAAPVPCEMSWETMKRSRLAGHAGNGYRAVQSRYHWELEALSGVRRSRDADLALGAGAQLHKISHRFSMSAVAHHRTTANSCFIAKSSALPTVHCGRLIRSRQRQREWPQYRHCPRLFTRCCLSSMRAIARRRTASSVTGSGSDCSFPSSLFSQCCSCSISNRYRISSTELTVSGQAPVPSTSHHRSRVAPEAATDTVHLLIGKWWGRRLAAGRPTGGQGN